MQVATDSCKGKLLKHTTTGGLVSSVRYGKGQSGTPWLPSPCQIVLCSRSGSARAGILFSCPCAIRLLSDHPTLSAEAVDAHFVTGLGGRKDSYYRKV